MTLYIYLNGFCIVWCVKILDKHGFIKNPAVNYTSHRQTYSEILLSLIFEIYKDKLVN